MNILIKLPALFMLFLLPFVTSRCQKHPGLRNEMVIDTNAVIINKTPSSYPIDNMPNALDPSATMIPHNEELICTDTDPEFPGGNKAMYQFFKKYLKKPEAASRARVIGKVYVSFMIARDGEIGDATILKGIGFGCDEEALRVVLLMPKWKPAQKDGEPISSRYSLPVIFE
ncbi:energy transducer TonB [Dyadobacter crusticola]|uniref:energy transducer TonB n=1 Tax=Dyadobacter crusticola TaxID=292407 RepID=UPI00068D7E2D|nr:energy transducer TonB [Dyadobacter crusticola]